MSLEDSKVKIDVGSVASEYIQNSSTVKTGTNSTKASGSSPSGQDSVSVGSSVSRLADLQAELAQVPEMREARVQELRSALLEGRYSVCSTEIAGKLIAEMFGGSR
jgi:flagellar biosynthesis anti-sigma factor FlgM